MEYIVEYIRKNGKPARKTIEANSFSELSVAARQIPDFSHLSSVAAK